MVFIVPTTNSLLLGPQTTACRSLTYNICTITGGNKALQKSEVDGGGVIRANVYCLFDSAPHGDLTIINSIHCNEKIILVHKYLLNAQNYCFLKKYGPTAASFWFIFGLIKQTIQFLQQISVKKCHVQDSNPQPLEHELPPMTTRPGLLPLLLKVVSSRWQCFTVMTSQ